MKMKNKLKIILLFLITSLSYSQDKITVLTNSTSTFIETYDYTSYNETYRLDKAIRIGPSTLKLLKTGIDTAIKWVNLNSEHNKQFSKEICRFKAMDKDIYEFHGYVENITNEYSMVFYGDNNGDFKLEIKTPHESDFIKIESYEMLQSFKKLLNGESTNSEIDDIFKK